MSKGQSGGGGGSQTSSSTFSPWMPWPLQEYWQRAEMLSQPQGGQYPGPAYQVAGINPTEYGGLGLELGSIPGMQQLLGLGSGALGTSLSGGYFNPNLNPYLSGAGPNQNPYLSTLGSMGGPNAFSKLTNNPYVNQYDPNLNNYASAATDMLKKQYAAATAPSQMSQAELSGAFGGSADAEARALNQYSLGQNIGNTLANIYEPAWQEKAQLYQQGAETQAGLQEAAASAASQQYGNQAYQQAGLYGTQLGEAIGNQTQSLGLLPSIMQAGTLPGETALGVGGLLQQQQQNQLNANYQNQYNQAFWPYQLVNWLGQAATGINTGFGQGRQTTNFSGGGPGMLQELLGGGLGLGGLASLLFGGGSNSAASGIGSAIGSLVPWIGSFF
jgi:hypothetical protein